MALSCDIKNYPFLTGDEFAEACHHLERRYCQATLGPVRKRWKLRSCRALNTTTLTLGTEYNTEMVDAEEADQSVVSRTRTKPGFGYVAYEIHLHPTYQGPVVWFSLHNLPADEPAFNIDTVFRRLVPDQYKDGLRTAGGIGGISADYHPVTGVPCFFVHPCLLGEAMMSFECTKETYLMVWLGLVGGAVGLWVPKEMAL
ncbi:hypothetical protein P8C59_007197 [Phyllachora maydis]|uniref:Ubiquitin-like-conjugating enzyme ATG10 n=1 Tax=Phyllachora maydis TaxID=1825666 RepID=A0AAD9I8D4_9PEZI|nr:hypothetical protein P8C59_007197 [Phyllachora maydis]